MAYSSLSRPTSNQHSNPLGLSIPLVLALWRSFSLFARILVPFPWKPQMKCSQYNCARYSHFHQNSHRLLVFQTSRSPDLPSDPPTYLHARHSSLEAEFLQGEMQSGLFGPPTKSVDISRIVKGDVKSVERCVKVRIIHG